jgi:hypothetical protein
MAEALLSPTCVDCARRLGYTAAKPWFMLHEGVCANCERLKVVSPSRDWKVRLPQAGRRR